MVEVGPHQFNFGRGQGHGILDSVLAEGREEGEEAELPCERAGGAAGMVLVWVGWGVGGVQQQQEYVGGTV